MKRQQIEIQGALWKKEHTVPAIAAIRLLVYRESAACPEGMLKLLKQWTLERNYSFCRWFYLKGYLWPKRWEEVSEKQKLIYNMPKMTPK